MSKILKFGQKRLILPLFPEKQGDFDPKTPFLDALLTKLNSYTPYTEQPLLYPQSDGGDYYILVQDSGGVYGDYSLTVAGFNCNDVNEPNDDVGSATMLISGTVSTGTFCPNDDNDLFLIEAEAGDIIDLSVNFSSTIISDTFAHVFYNIYSANTEGIAGGELYTGLSMQLEAETSGLHQLSMFFNYEGISPWVDTLAGYEYDISYLSLIHI